MINNNENEAKKEKSIIQIWHNKPKPRHGHKYTKYKMCLNILIDLCIKQHLTNI